MPDDMHKDADPRLFHFARLNRRAMTDAERRLWECLRDRRLGGYKFRRQHPVYNFIADFFCLEANLIIELDGGYHNELEQHQYDEGRTYELKELGLRVIRFINQEVMEGVENVLDRILVELESWG